MDIFERSELIGRAVGTSKCCKRKIYDYTALLNSEYI